MASAPLIRPAAGDDARGDRRHRLLAGDQDQRPGPIAIGVEIGEFVALPVPHGGITLVGLRSFL